MRSACVSNSRGSEPPCGSVIEYADPHPGSIGRPFDRGLRQEGLDGPQLPRPQLRSDLSGHHGTAAIGRGDNRGLWRGPAGQLAVSAWGPPDPLAQNPANWREFWRRRAPRVLCLRNRGLHGGASRIRTGGTLPGVRLPQSRVALAPSEGGSRIANATFLTRASEETLRALDSGHDLPSRGR